MIQFRLMNELISDTESTKSEKFRMQGASSDKSIQQRINFKKNYNKEKYCKYLGHPDTYNKNKTNSYSNQKSLPYAYDLVILIFFPLLEYFILYEIKWNYLLQSHYKTTEQNGCLFYQISHDLSSQTLEVTTYAYIMNICNPLMLYLIKIIVRLIMNN